MEQLTVYRVQGKTIGLVFLFKYDLNGFIRTWDVSEGELNQQQSFWLFALSEGQTIARFPWNENDFKVRWLNNTAITDKFEIDISPANLSFTALWEQHDHKVSKVMAQKAYSKLKEADLIPCFLGNAKYQKYIATKPNLEKMHLATFINQRRWEDEYDKLPAKQPYSKTDNPVLKDIAWKKTEK